MATIICFANNKGGVGKSTLTMNLGGALSELGKKTLLVDLDPQANLNSVFVDSSKSVSLSVGDVLCDDTRIEEAIRTTKIDNLSILPASSKLQDMDSRLAGDEDAQFYLSEELETVKNHYDYVIIDSPPNLSKATRMALVAADFVVIPIQCQDWAVKGCKHIMSYMKRVQQRANPNLKLLGIVINRFNARRKMEVLYHRILHENFANRLFQTVFRDHVPYVEAVTAKEPNTSYQPGSPQAKVCRAFAQEVIARVQKQNR
jgi:chromosome partitioning protein